MPTDPHEVSLTRIVSGQCMRACGSESNLDPQVKLSDRQMTQHLVNEWQKLTGGVGITGIDGVQDSRDVAHFHSK